jgi:hypothetical protein
MNYVLWSMHIDWMAGSCSAPAWIMPQIQETADILWKCKTLEINHKEAYIMHQKMQTWNSRTSPLIPECCIITINSMQNANLYKGGDRGC